MHKTSRRIIAAGAALAVLGLATAAGAQDTVKIGAVYPLSGGFKSWSLISVRLARRALKVERAIEPVVARWIGFRVMLVVEKAAGVDR